MGITTLKNNNMTYKYFILKQIDNEIVVIANKEPEPKYPDVFNERIIKPWEKNHETFKPYDEHNLKQIISSIEDLSYMRGHNLLQQGIEITCCEIRSVVVNVDPNGQPEEELFAFYKPEEQKEESRLKKFFSNVDDVEYNKVEKNMLLAARLDDIIKQRGYNKGQFAFIMGVQKSVVTRWLSGTHNFTIDTLFEVEKKLGITIINVHYNT
jgi:predicted XRE-type DNA-binding protein